MANVLTQKVGPYPMYVWGGIGAGGLVLAYFLRKGFGSGSSGAPAEPSGDAEGDEAPTQVEYLPQPIPSAPVAPGGLPGGTAPPAPRPPSQPPKGGQTTPTPRGNQGPFPPGRRPGPQAPVPPVVVPVPQRPGAPPPPPAPQNPPQPPAPQAPSYPGLPAGYRLDCSRSYTGRLSSFEVAWNAIRATQNETFSARNISALAIGGIGSPWIGTGNWASPQAINQRRVANGLYPLTQAEIDQLITMVNAQSNANPKVLHTKAGAQQLFNTWNAPFQCPNGGGPRRER